MTPSRHTKTALLERFFFLFVESSSASSHILPQTVTVMQGGLVRRFSAVACAASLAIMPALARRL